LTPPLKLIPVAEEDMRLINEIGTWVLRKACKTAATRPEPLKVAVNLSPLQFDAGNFCGRRGKCAQGKPAWLRTASSSKLPKAFCSPIPTPF
jgi:EAL domain-containing protein (putative c-di-GMP-specific phosphodiesterase class I)